MLKKYQNEILNIWINELNLKKTDNIIHFLKTIF